jgi:hypothetical protein
MSLLQKAKDKTRKRKQNFLDKLPMSEKAEVENLRDWYKNNPECNASARTLAELVKSETSCTAALTTIEKYFHYGFDGGNKE